MYPHIYIYTYMPNLFHDFQWHKLLTQYISLTTFSVPEEICIDINVVTESWGNENSWTFGACESKQEYGNDETFTEECCQPRGDYELVCKCSYGDGWHGGYLEISGKKYCERFTSGKEKKETATQTNGGNIHF